MGATRYVHVIESSYMSRRVQLDTAHVSHEWDIKLNKRKDIPTSTNYVLFCLFYKQTDNDVFENFLKIYDPFLKTSNNSPKIFWSPHKSSWTFSKNFQWLPKISKDLQGWSEDVQIIR